MPKITKQEFSRLLKNRLGDDFDDASKIFDQYSARGASFEVTHLLVHAVRQNKVADVLYDLAYHWDYYLGRKHRDAKIDRTTKAFFHRLRQYTLQLHPLLTIRS